jgi:hypothetical protein
MTVKESAKSILQTLKMAVPMIVGILLLISMVNPIFQQYYPRVFTGNFLLDPLLGALAGSIAFGMPLTSYVAGGELLEKGVSLLAVTAFVLAWTTVGVAMLPLEIKFMGKKFALLRNGLNFLNSIVIAVILTIILQVL